MATRKTLLGSKIRRLRQERGLTQAQAAERLGISPSYLNLIEHDERSVTVSLLLKLGQTFGVDLQELSDDTERRLAAGLREVFADPTLSRHAIDNDEIGKLAAASPKGAQAVIELYRAWRSAREDAQALTLGLPSGTTRRVVLPAEEARDFFEGRANYFGEIEAEAERVGANLGTGDELRRGLTEALQTRHAISVSVEPQAAMGGALRRFDPKARTLRLSEVLPPPSRRFHLAYQLGLLEARGVMDQAIAAAKLASPDSETLCRVGLANYLAGAVLMPYGPFLEAARATRYDIEALMHRFGVSFEQAGHRLSTLQRPTDRGVPFFFVRIDIAGNVTKRFSAAGFHLSRFGGSCPRWVTHEAFLTPALIRTQIARLPDGATFFCLARTVERPGGSFHAPASRHAVGIGCALSDARSLVYADGLDLERLEAVAEIGVGCRLCERADCRQRAFPPLQHRLVVDETVKGPSAYSFDSRR
jgi:predicted transcriptional regulator/DNA-binding XRE family transcriptional regulator